MNISAGVGRTMPEQTSIVSDRLREAGLGEIRAIEETTGKIIIILDGNSVKEETRKLKQIQKIEGVFTTDIAYAYSDQDFNKSNMSRVQKEPKSE